MKCSYRESKNTKNMAKKFITNLFQIVPDSANRNFIVLQTLFVKPKIVVLLHF